MAIQYLSNKNLDLVKYDACVLKSSNFRIYALTWYLNSVTDSWDALVLNDYEAVMPLPNKKIYGISYIYQAPWIQQLGVFSKNIIDEFTMVEFLRSIPKKFILVDYFFNLGSTFKNKHTKERVNYILPLSQDFKTIRSNYNKTRKRISNKIFNDYVIDVNGNMNDFLELYKNQNYAFKTHKDAFKMLKKLLKSKNQAINIWMISLKGEFIAGLIWLKDKYRITYLLPIANEVAKQNNVPTYIVNKLIEKNQNTNCVLDFEGSMNEGVANFYKSFGAEKEIYYWYKKQLI